MKRKTRLETIALLTLAGILVLTAMSSGGEARSKEVNDDSPPVITLISPLNGTITNQNVTLSYTVRDNVDSLENITIIGPSNGTVYTNESAYAVTIAATDRANNTAWLNISFTIDRTPPTITILNVADGAYYNADIMPVIAVTDANRNITSITLNGTPFTSGTKITDEGNYTLNIEATDKANNSAARTIFFVIDKTAPAPITNITAVKITEASITLTWNATAEEDFNKYEIWSAKDEKFSAPALIANFTDRNVTSYEIKDLAPSTIYYFKIKVIDKAGNEAMSTLVNFTTSRQYPTLDLSLIGIISGEVAIIIILAVAINRKLKKGKELKKF
ncbi:MAG: fibronectin type III domain-containing protein [Candidatus Thermoplasmatota archaeon]